MYKLRYIYIYIKVERKYKRRGIMVDRRIGNERGWGGGIDRIRI